MNPIAQKENAKTLAAALGIEESEAMSLLAVSVAITCDSADTVASEFAEHVRLMISRTVSDVVVKGGEGKTFAVELIIGDAKPRFDVAQVFVGIKKNEVEIDEKPCGKIESGIPKVGILLGACYAVGAILKKAFNDLLPFPAPKSLRINLTELFGDDLPLLDQEVDFGEAFLAGAGAIGNGFVFALSQFRARGTLHVVDDDFVSAGNLQRCLYFDDAQIGLSKSDCLCASVKYKMPHVEAIPQKVRLQNIELKKAGPWLKRLIVGVDSPRARRSLQTEIPQEVFDASTTGIEEVVFHFHRQPTDLACLSCAYHESPAELAHERHVAEVLGVSIGDVRTERISQEIARSIQARYPLFSLEELTGLAYDTLFKELCSTGKLLTPEGKQVLAPFAFVSVLAGTFLAIEFVLRIQNPARRHFNDWRISPWANPVLRRRRLLPRLADCEFCGDARIARVLKSFWPEA